MFTKQQAPLLVTLGLGVIFVILLVLNLWSFALVDLFLIAIAITLIKKHDVKTVLLLLSPILVYPAIYFLIGIIKALIEKSYTQLLMWTGIRIVYLPLIIFSLLYAYLFRHYLTKLVEPRARWWAFGICVFLLVMSFVASHVVGRCYMISRAEKGITNHEIEFCKKWDQYVPTSSSKFSGLPEYVEAELLWPPVIILAGMLIQFGFSSRKRKKG